MITEIDIILMELVIVQHPEYFIPKFNIKGSKGKNFNNKKLKDYYKLISGINWFVKKISRYEAFFINFYPITNKISKHEALEHHIHAYLEDLQTLKIKLVNFVNQVKNDSKKKFQNKKEIATHLTFTRSKIYDAFKNVSKHRSSHRHGNYRFIDIYVIDGEVASSILRKQPTVLKDCLTKYGLEKFQCQEKESFENGKKYWSCNASKNYKQIDSLSSEVLKINKKLLFKLIDIKPYGIKK